MATYLAFNSFLKTIRLHQWVKNLLLFIPLLTAYQFTNLQLVWQTLLGFLAFSFTASAVYIINDLLDAKSDRHHPVKKNRAFTAGDISLTQILILLLIMLLCGLMLTWFLPIRFAAALLIYFLVSNLYSIFFKKIILLDVIILSLLYTLRIIAGSAATHIPLSEWLLVFSVFLFLSLAMLKRVAELQILRQYAEQTVAGRGYLITDLEQLRSLGGASGYIAVLVFALYISSSDILKIYSHPKILWLVCPLFLYWISRVWLLAARGRVQDDPIVFALQDKVSYVVGFLTVILIFIAR